MGTYKGDGNNLSILNVELRLPTQLKSVIESIWRITDREIDDLCSLLIIDQLNYFKEDQEAILEFMKDYETFNENLAKGIDQYYEQHLK